MFKSGDEVTPYNPVWSDSELAESGLTRGGVYVVSEIGLNTEEGPWLLLEGINSPLGEEWAFKVDGFRKVQKRSTETGMSIFKEIAAGKRKVDMIPSKRPELLPSE